MADADIGTFFPATAAPTPRREHSKKRRRPIAGIEFIASQNSGLRGTGKNEAKIREIPGGASGSNLNHAIVRASTEGHTHSMKRRHFLQTGLLALPGLSPLAAGDLEKLEAAATILETAADSGQVHAASLFVQQGDTIFAESFGAASPSVDSIFLLASITKPICIAAVMALHEQGEFELDDPAIRFIPEFKGKGRETITIRQLMTHVSGLPDQLPQNANLRSQHADLSEFVDGAIRTPLLFEPGTKYSYSSMGILLATELAQRITGKPIAELVNIAVYEPLGMKHSALGAGSFPLDSLMNCQVKTAAPESGAGDPTTKSWDWNSRYWRELGVPWGGAHGSASDVGKFLRAFLHPDGDFLKENTARMMIRNQNAAGIRPRGLGFDVGSIPGSPGNETTFGHTGSTGTICWADPNSDTTCVVLTTLPAKVGDQAHPRHMASQCVADSIG